MEYLTFERLWAVVGLLLLGVATVSKRILRERDTDADRNKFSTFTKSSILRYQGFLGRGILSGRKW